MLGQEVVSDSFQAGEGGWTMWMGWPRAATTLPWAEAIPISFAIILAAGRGEKEVRSRPAPPADEVGWASLQHATQLP